MKIAENDRDMLEYLTEACESQVYVCDQCGHEEALSTFDIASDLRDYMTAEQHLGEPVAQVRDDIERVSCIWFGPRPPHGTNLYTHADPGEVERLREENDAIRLQGGGMQMELDELRAQLAERDALLERALRLLTPNVGRFRGSVGWAVEVDRFVADLDRKS